MNQSRINMNTFLLLRHGNFDKGTADALAIQIEHELAEYGHLFKTKEAESDFFTGFLAGAVTMRDLIKAN